MLIYTDRLIPRTIRAASLTLHCGCILKKSILSLLIFACCPILTELPQSTGPRLPDDRNFVHCTAFHQSIPLAAVVALEDLRTHSDLHILRNQGTDSRLHTHELGEAEPAHLHIDYSTLDPLKPHYSVMDVEAGAERPLLPLGFVA